MREIHAEFDGTYGEPRMTVELANRGWAVNHKRVRRLMRVHGIVGVHKPAKVRTTMGVSTQIDPTVSTARPSGPDQMSTPTTIPVSTLP